MAMETSGHFICMGTSIALSRPGVDRHNHLAAGFPPSTQVFLNGLENVSRKIALAMRVHRPAGMFSNRT